MDKVEDSLKWFGTGNMSWVHGMTGKVADRYAAPALPRCCLARVDCSRTRAVRQPAQCSARGARGGSPEAPDVVGGGAARGQRPSQKE